MNQISPLRRRNLRRRRPVPILRWTHILGFVLGLIPLGVVMHRAHIDGCNPISWEVCRNG